MFEQYNHLLIPGSADFVPSPDSVAVMFEMLGRAGAVPREASLRLGVLTGATRKGSNPYTGEITELPRRDYRRLADVSEVPECLARLDDYDLFLEGNGPAKSVSIPAVGRSEGGPVYTSVRLQHLSSIAERAGST